MGVFFWNLFRIRTLGMGGSCVLLKYVLFILFPIAQQTGRISESSFTPNTKKGVFFCGHVGGKTMCGRRIVHVGLVQDQAL